MLEIDFTWQPAKSHWTAESTPDEFPKGYAAWVAGEPNFNPPPRDYRLVGQDPAGKFAYQTSSIHARSCYLGQDESGCHYFAKGVGWILADGWTPKFGSTGILPLWAAERERDVALQLARLGLRVVEPISIQLHQTIPAHNTGHAQHIDPESVLDLDQSKALPSMYAYRSRCRWRLADLPFLRGEQRETLFDELGGAEFWLEQLIDRVSESIGILHKNNGYDHSLSAHNVFLSGERLDFEYAVAPGQPHRLSELNINEDGWREKELYSFKLMCYEITELLGVEWSSLKLESLIRRRYEELTSKKFPF